MLRIGHGFDVHAFTDGNALVIGGVRIPYHHAFLAHSDGDVLIHALCDALLGAAALGDIGQHFPDSDNEFANIGSRILLRQVIDKLQTAGYSLHNADLTIVAQAPKMQAYLPAMRECLASDCQVDCSAINIKATTTEQLGFTGRGEGIAVHAVCLLY